MTDSHAQLVIVHLRRAILDAAGQVVKHEATKDRTREPIQSPIVAALEGGANSDVDTNEADRAALDALPPADRAELFATARAKHPLLRAVKADDSSPLLIAEALRLHHERQRVSA